MTSALFSRPHRNGVSVPDVMREFPQFVVWRLIQKTGKLKPDKVPFCPHSRRPASVNDPSTWSDYATACATFQKGGFDGIGFVFTIGDRLVFIDLDNGKDPVTGKWKPHVLLTTERFCGAWEVSQSGNGLHGLGFVADKTKLASKRRKWNDEYGNSYEFYTHGRFIAFGGTGWTGEIGPDWTEELASWIPDASNHERSPPIDWIDQPRAGYDGPTDDDELIRSACASRSPAVAFGKAAPFKMLWSADPRLGEFFPDKGGQDRAFDHSSAELALVNGLAWWTGCNPIRMERLFNRSELARDDDRKARLAITKALADANRGYCSRAQRLHDDQEIGNDVTFRVEPEIRSLAQALDDLVSVGGSHVVSRASKRVRTFPDAVRENAASKEYIETDRIDRNGRPVPKCIPVSKLWLESPDRLSVDVITWSPGDPEFCFAPERQQAGDRAYNLWTPPSITPPPTDWEARVQPFLRHIDYLIPQENERCRFLQWIAHIFQRPGELPHTCYLMIATQTGIGRGTLASMLTRALRGYVAANMNIDALFGGFNGRVSQKLLATVDEVREGNSSNRYAKAEALKSKITEEVRALNPKYGAQSVEKNCCRWLMFSNHLDALPFDNNDRRIVVIENPAIREHANWYSQLHDLIKEPAFIASIQNYFLMIDLTGFNPHEIAPINEVKRKALAALESDVARACQQFVSEWPADLATVLDLRAYIGDDAPINSRAFQHEFGRAGMQTAGRLKITGRMETVLIVRGSLTSEEIMGASRQAIVEQISAARLQFRSTVV